MPKRKIVILIIMLLLLSITPKSNAVGVRPLVIDLNLSPGDSESFELLLTPGSTQESVELNLYHPTQQITGGLSYEKGDTDKHSAIDWINLESNEIIVPPDEETRVKGEVNVPYDAAGSHTVVAMIEPVVDEAETGITFRVRYAVRININVDRPGLREEAEVLDFSLQADEENNPLLSVHLNNPSPLHYHAAAEVTVRDEDRRLIERVILRSQAAASAGRDVQRIYPGSEVLFSGQITEPLHPGSYDLQLFMYYSEGRQIIQRKSVELDDEFLDLERMEYVEVEPEAIQETLRPGGSTTQSVSIRNRTGDPLLVQIGGQEIEPDYPHSIFEKVDLQLRGDQEMELDARRSGRTVLVLRTPRDIAEAGYYGTLQVGVFSDSGEHLETREIDMEILIGEEHDYAVEFLDLTTKVFGDEYLFSATVSNKGLVHLAPEARIYLRDESGDIQRTLRLSLQEDVDRILPGMTSHLVTTAGNLEPGEYRAEVRVEHLGEELATDEIPVVLEPIEEE